MIHHNQIPEDIAIRVPYEDIHSLVVSILAALGLSDGDAQISADALLYADIRGIDSHGVSNMLPHYVEWIKNGYLNSQPNLKVVRQAAATATIDGDEGLGLSAGKMAMGMALDKAGDTGIGSVVVNNSRHCGATAYYAHMALERDMIGIAMTVGGVMMPPTFGAKAMIGSNPIACAVPTKTEPPFVFDAATTSVAANRIVINRRLGTEIPGGWIARPDGTPIMESGLVPDEFLVLPTGGTREGGSHKGYGLGVMVDILSGLLGGEPPSFHRQSTNRIDVSHHFIAYRIDAFTDPEAFKVDMDFYMKGLRETPPAEGYEQVYYAGLPEHETEIQRRQKGIPYHPEVIEWFCAIASELGVDHPLKD